jgi:hypothetical protein
MASDDFWREIFHDGESDDEEFEGFTAEEVAQSELLRIRREIQANRALEGFDNDQLSDSEVSVDDSSDEEDEDVTIDPAQGAYDCEWLKDFDEESGPKNVPNTASEYEIFAHFFTDEVVNLLVTETNEYYRQVIEKKGGVDTLPKFSVCLSACLFVCALSIFLLPLFICLHDYVQLCIFIYFSLIF